MSLIPHHQFPRSAFDMDQWLRHPQEMMNQQLNQMQQMQNRLNTQMNQMSQQMSQHQMIPPTTLDLFDPFDELDHMISRNLQWLNKPEFLQPLQTMMPKVPQKYRIVVDCAGYKPESVKTQLEGNKLFVIGHEEVKHNGEDFSIKEFKNPINYQLTQNQKSLLHL